MTSTTAVATAPAQMTEIEKYIEKHEGRLLKMKHIDVLPALRDVVFPILRKLAAASGDQAEALADLAEQVKANGDDNLALFEASKDVIEKLTVLLDTAMVAAGFYKVTRTGLTETGKAPPDLYQAYASVAIEVGEVMEDLGTAIEDLAGEEGGEGEEGGDGANTAANVGPVGVQGADVVASAIVAGAIANAGTNGADPAAPAGPDAGPDVDPFEPPSGAPDTDVGGDGGGAGEGGPDAAP